jgi:hypothetical protein
MRRSTPTNPRGDAAMNAATGRHDAFCDEFLIRDGFQLTATYDYVAGGELLYQTLRYQHPTEDERFLARRPDGNGSWLLGPGERRILYRADDRKKVAHDTIFLTCGGEHDADRLASRGFVAVAVALGQWSEECIRALTGRDVFILETSGAKSRKSAREAAALLYGVARTVRIVGLPGLATTGDVSQWLDEGNDHNRILDVAKAAPLWEPGGESESKPADELPIFDPWDSYSVPKFPLEIMPQAVQQFINEQSRVIGCDPSALAMALLAGFSGAVDHRFKLRMMRNGCWSVSPRLWVLLVGDPSRKKTPIINTALSELEEHQDRRQRRFHARMKEYQSALAAHDKKSKEPPPTAPEKPARFVVVDTTVEKAGEILARSPQGVIVKHDELAGWIAGMERYASKGSAGSDRAFWLKAYDGGPYLVDRITRGELYIENLSVSVVGGVQPEKLAEMHGLTSDGLLQRFIPVMMGLATFPVDDPASPAKDQVRRLARQLISAEPASLILSDEALPVLEATRRHVHELEQVGGSFAKGFQGFLGKLSGIAGSLALILHLISDPPENRLHPVSKKTAEDVSRLVIEFILPHAFEFYRTAETVTDGDRLQRLASWILTSRKERVTARDLTHNVRDLRGVTIKEVQLRVAPLVAGGWLEPENPGPECKVWKVTPAVALQLDHRRRVEDARKAKVAKLMGSPRKPKQERDW